MCFTDTSLLEIVARSDQFACGSYGVNTDSLFNEVTVTEITFWADAVVSLTVPHSENQNFM
jgi:hypothetical protein